MAQLGFLSTVLVSFPLGGKPLMKATQLVKGGPGATYVAPDSVADRRWNSRLGWWSTLVTSDPLVALRAIAPIFSFPSFRRLRIA